MLRVVPFGEELLVAMARIGATGDRASGDIESCEECCCAVAYVVVSPSLDLPGLHGVRPGYGELDIDTKTCNALLRSLRYQGERGFALMSQRWRAIQHVSLSPTTIGDIVKSALVLTQFEHKMIS